VQDCDGGVGELDGEDAVVVAGLLRLEEFAAEDCEDSGLWGEVGGGGVDSEAVFGGEGSEGVVLWRDDRSASGVVLDVGCWLGWWVAK
jgi:hypothetical protein